LKGCGKAADLDHRQELRPSLDSGSARRDSAMA
jgi:hypothetical protein